MFVKFKMTRFVYLHYLGISSSQIKEQDENIQPSRCLSGSEVNLLLTTQFFTPAANLLIGL